MALEIERKFLVVDQSYRSDAESKHEIEQGYLSTDPERTVRIRIADDKGWLTIKSRNEGCVRSEWEYAIPVEDARQMLHLAKNVLSKTRYNMGRWEVDEFHGRHQGLTIAEIELGSADECIELPGFVGEEVTGDPRYYNSVIAGRDE